MFRGLLPCCLVVIVAASIGSQCGQESSDGTCPSSCQLGAGNVCAPVGSSSICSNGGAPKGHPTVSQGAVSCPTGYQVEGNWCCPVVSYDSSCLDAHPQCPDWVQNGFCTNYWYTQAHRKAACPKSCSLCSG